MTAFDPEKITFFAKTDARGREVAFGIKAKDRQRHMYVVGKTGMGKSTMLENMAAQDIINGEGIAFIDPHGTTAQTLLEYVPEHRVKDVVYFAPFDLDHPISFNVMEDVGPDKRHLVVSGLMSTFKKIWVDAWSARMEYILTNALLALIEYPDTTLLSVNRLFVDKEFRTRVVNYIQDPAVKAFWTDEFANYTDRFTAEALPAIQNKIGQFTGNPLIRNIIGQPHSSFDIRELMDNQKILIMNLSKGLIGETNANLLGSMLTTRIYLAAMSRADLQVDEMKRMPNFYFYVDEFQSFANATFANILSEARKYHLNLIIAHQYIEQMEEDVRNAVFGNVGSTIAFRVGPFDAELLETVFSPRFLATDLVNLGFAQIYLTLMIDGIGSHPFSAKTLPPVERPSISCRNMVVESSRQLYAHRREDVEKIVAELHTPQHTEEKRASDRRTSGGVEGGRRATDQRRGEGQVVVRENQTQAPKVNRIPLQDQFKKKRPERTPEDLKQILSTLTQKEQKEKEVTEVVTVPEKPPAPVAVQSTPTPPVQARPAQTSAEKPSELKQALADALQKVSDKTPPPTPIVVAAKPSIPPAAQPEKMETFVPVAAPAPIVVAAPEKVVVPTPEVTQPKPPAIPPAQRVADQQSDYRSQIRKVIVEHRKQTESFTPKTASIISKNEQSKMSGAEVNEPSLDIAKIRRMLGQSTDERSPFK
ncbi:MAG: type IV secretion system DNA-binding domain-containing protein [Candidatus Pacebacteria bacterium]|nr:type IV secretion system DNA-binding domain-containing protein [Candidatus Paceibacterota bacterium]